MSSHHFRDDPGRTPGLLGPENEQTRRVYSVSVFTDNIMRKADRSLWPSGCTRYDIRIGDPLFRWAPELGAPDGVFSLLNNIHWWGGEWTDLTDEGKRMFLKDNLRFVGIAASSVEAKHGEHPIEQSITANRQTIAALKVRNSAKAGDLIEWFLPPSGSIEYPLIMWFRKWEAPTVETIIEIGKLEGENLEEEGENDGSGGFGIRQNYRNYLFAGPSEDNFRRALHSALSFMRFKKNSVVGTFLSSLQSGPYNSIDIH